MLKFEVKGTTLIIKRYPKEVHIKFESEFELRDYLSSILAVFL